MVAACIPFNLNKIKRLCRSRYRYLIKLIQGKVYTTCNKYNEIYACIHFTLLTFFIFGFLYRLYPFFLILLIPATFVYA